MSRHATDGAGRGGKPAVSQNPMMLRSAASPGSVGSVGRHWRIVASSYRCQFAGRPPFSGHSSFTYLPKRFVPNEKRRLEGGVLRQVDGPGLLDLGFLELDVLLDDRIV